MSGRDVNAEKSKYYTYSCLFNKMCEKIKLQEVERSKYNVAK